MPEFSINMTTDLLKDVIYRRIRDMIINGTLPTVSYTHLTLPTT